MTTQIRIDTNVIIAHITPHMTGACMEDVNHEVYGGIYSQMVFGESFEEEGMPIDARLDAAFEGRSPGKRSTEPAEPCKGETTSGHLVAPRQGFDVVVPFTPGDARLRRTGPGLTTPPTGRQVPARWAERPMTDTGRPL